MFSPETPKNMPSLEEIVSHCNSIMSDLKALDFELKQTIRNQEHLEKTVMEVSRSMSEVGFHFFLFFSMHLHLKLYALFSSNFAYFVFLDFSSDEHKTLEVESPFSGRARPYLCWRKFTNVDSIFPKMILTLFDFLSAS